MTINTIIAIAELCRASGYGNASVLTRENGIDAAQRQLSCQKEYVTCVNKKITPFFKHSDAELSDALSECIMEKK